MNQQIETNLIFEKNKSSAKKMPRKELIYRNDAIKSKCLLMDLTTFYRIYTKQIFSDFESDIVHSVRFDGS